MTPRIRNLLRRTLTTHRLLDDGEQVLIAVSGGADSLCLLSLLVEYNRRQRKDWRILAVHVDPGFPGWKTARLERIFRRLEVEYEIARTQVPVRQEACRENLCYVCARERRKRLFEIARSQGIAKIALAHHLEDVNETYFLNLIYTASARTFLPRQDLFSGGLQVIRPLYSFDRDMIVKYAKSANLRPVHNRCPGAQTGKRAVIRRFLNRLYREYPRIRNNIFAGIRNLKAEYLP